MYLVILGICAYDSTENIFKSPKKKSKHEEGRISDKGDSLINSAVTNKKSTSKNQQHLHKNQRNLNGSRKGACLVFSHCREKRCL